MPDLISSLQNPGVKHVVRLRDRRHRDEEGLLLVEGVSELALAIAGGARPQTVYFCPAFGTDSSQLLAKAVEAGAEAIEVTANVFEKMAYRENPDGILAVLPTIRRRLDDLPGSERPLYLVAEAVEKPGNLGALLRSADAAGVTGVIVCDPATDINNPNVVRSSRGTLFTVPVAEAATADTIAWLRGRGVATIAATPQASLDFGGWK